MVKKRRRRDPLEITEKILTVALKGASATKIVYDANLDFKRFKTLSHRLVRKGLLTVEHTGRSSRKIYRTTQKGRHLLNLLREVRSLI